MFLTVNASSLNELPLPAMGKPKVTASHLGLYPRGLVRSEINGNLFEGGVVTGKLWSTLM